MIEPAAIAERIDRVMAAAEFTWSDPELARKWMNHPHGLLGGRTPREFAETEIGACRVEKILANIVYGLPV